MRNRRLATLALVGVLGITLTACSGGSDNTGTLTSGTPTSSPPSAASDKLTITAPSGSANTGFSETEVSALANTPLTITFVNDDKGVPHNVQVFQGSEATGTPVFAPSGDDALITGPATATYAVPALAAGTYTYNCAVHPTTMVGTLTVA